MSIPGRIVSDWYELVVGEELRQGDILLDCPVILPPKDFPSTDLPPPLLDMEITLSDVIVLSQSCDLVDGQKSDMWLVVTCPVWTLEEMAASNDFLKSSYGREICRRGHLPGYHMLSGLNHEESSFPLSIVNFREVISLPLSLVRSIASARGQRLRLRTPFRERLSQAFGRYFMRVATESDISPFESDKDEREVSKLLHKMPYEKRAGILEAFRGTISDQ